jgi:hypothetical protein
MAALTVWANLDQADWRSARHIGWAQVALVFAGALAPGAIGWALGRLGPNVVPSPAPDLTVLTLRPGERAVWVARTHNRWLLLMGGVGIVAGFVTLAWGLRAAAVPLFLIGLAGLLSGSIRVEASAAGVAVAYGPWGWPVWHKPLAKIALARAERLNALEAGGWGIRGLPGNAVLMLRSGECLVLEYVNGGNFRISVDDASNAAALLNALRDNPRRSNA